MCDCITVQHIDPVNLPRAVAFVLNETERILLSLSPS
jgi:hypothetical protein